MDAIPLTVSKSGANSAVASAAACAPARTTDGSARVAVPKKKSPTGKIKEGMIEVEGRVTEFRWQNPHVVFTLDVADGKGATVPWAIETLSITLYLLAGYLRNTDKSTEAGLKYFVLGALSYATGDMRSAVVVGLPDPERMERVHIELPPEFPLDEEGRLPCATCHNLYAGDPKSWRSASHSEPMGSAVSTLVDVTGLGLALASAGAAFSFALNSASAALSSASNSSSSLAISRNSTSACASISAHVAMICTPCSAPYRTGRYRIGALRP